MKIRRKLFLLLLAIALLPLMFVSWSDHLATRNLGLELAVRGREIITERMTSQLRQMIETNASILRGQRKLVELALRVQAMEVEARLAVFNPVGGKVYFDRQFDAGANPPPGLAPSRKHLQIGAAGKLTPARVTYREQVIRLVPGLRPNMVREDINRLSSMTSVYRSLYRAHPELIFWQYTSLETGVHSSYPGHGGYPRGYDPRKRSWYRQAKDMRQMVWSPPIVDASTKQLLLTASTPVRRPDGSFAGVTAIDVEILSLLQEIQNRSRILRDFETFIVEPSLRPDGSGTGVRIIAHQGYGLKNRKWDTAVSLDWLKPDNPGGEVRLVNEMLAGKTSLTRMRHKGRDSLWAYKGIDEFNTHLLFLVPFDRIESQVQKIEGIVRGETGKQLFTAGFVSAFMIAVVFLLAVVNSKKVTAPVRELADAARRVAGGDFQARAKVRSRDELGELGEAFNEMVVDLEDRMKVRRALSMAMEVQQNLLPDHPPVIAGFDIAGGSVYSDETGGDYYDYIPLDGAKGERLGIAVGDVSGHGIAAALLMATVRALLRSRAPQSDSPADLISEVNRNLAANIRGGRFVTLFYLEVDRGSRTLTWVNAGHNTALAYDPESGEVEELSAADIPLGIQSGWNYREVRRTEWAPGRILFIGTDGIWETRSPSGEMFGKAAVSELMRRHAKEGAERIYRAIEGALSEFRGEGLQRDDITMVVVKSL